MLIKSVNTSQEVVNINDIYIELCKDNRNVVMTKILDEVFMFRPLSRLEYKEIIENDDLTPVEKEDVICQVCTLYPKDYDFTNCLVAGIPTKLANEIIKESYVNDPDTYNMIINSYRQELSEDLDAQIVCIINAAFPNYDIEEIETWDIEKTAKYLTRAEYILVNLKNVNLDIPAYIDTIQKEESDEMKKHEAKVEDTFKNEKEVNLKGGPKQKIDLDKLREAQEKIPEIDWLGDSILQEGIDALNVTADTTPYALRTPEEF